MSQELIATVIVFGIIILSFGVGVSTGLNGQIVRLGKGIKGLIIAAIVVLFFSQTIFQIPFIIDVKNSLDNWVYEWAPDIFEKVLSKIIAYIILYIFVLICIKIIFQVIGSFITSNNNPQTPNKILNILNKILGGLLSMSIGIVFIMVAFAFIIKLGDSTVDIINILKNSPCRIFLQINPFIDIFSMIF